METAFSIILLALVVLFYLSNRHNKINRWCCVAGLYFWLGIAKEAVLYNIIPLFNDAELVSRFMPVYSVCTWALYSFAMPSTLVVSILFCVTDQKRPELARVFKAVPYIPAIIFSFFFPPLEFRSYQLSSLPFWVTYAIYNLSYTVLFIILLTLGVAREKPGKIKTQKKRVRAIIMPPVMFWAFSVFLTHPFNLSGLLKLWQLNAFILLASVIIFIILAFKDGSMGLKLSRETFNWNTNMNIINTGAEYTNHMLKNQTAKMDMCIEHLKAYFSDSADGIPEELNILSRSIITLRSYVEKMKRQSENISLKKEPCVLSEMIGEAVPDVFKDSGRTEVQVEIPMNMVWICDRRHMTEVFSNLTVNAFEAILGSGVIRITGAFDKQERNFLLSVTDDGSGIDADELGNIFNPYYTTKNSEKNFGLGLTYCKNVVEKHGGSIYAKSKPGKGTTIIIAFPSEQVLTNG